MLGHLVEVVDLAPVEDPLAVGLGAGQHARVGAGRDQDDVALQLLADLAVGVRDLDAMGGEAADLVGEPPCPATIRTPSPARRAWMSADWAIARALTRSFTVARSTLTVAVGALQPEDGGVAHDVMAPAAAMRVLDGHAVGEHADAPDAVALDDGDLGPELGGDQRGLVAGRSAADDHDAGHGPFPGAEPTFGT